MLHEVVEAGYEITPEDIDADIIIINTCAFIESARARKRWTISWTSRGSRRIAISRVLS